VASSDLRWIGDARRWCHGRFGGLIPELRHVYAERSDLLGTVTMGCRWRHCRCAAGLPAAAAVRDRLEAKAGPGVWRRPGGGPGPVPGDGLDGRAVQRSATEVWRLRLHPRAGWAAAEPWDEASPPGGDCTAQRSSQAGHPAGTR